MPRVGFNSSLSITSVTPELLQTLTTLIANVIQASANSAASGSDMTQSRGPPFTISEYRSFDATSIKDYFTHFTWALQLSKVPENQYTNYARVYMGTKLNDALKFFVVPRISESLTYEKIHPNLIGHFDASRNKFAESIKFRRTTQHAGETITNFSL